MERLTKPNKLKRKRKHGYRQRKKTRTGRAVLKRRRLKGRKRVSV